METIEANLEVLSPRGGECEFALATSVGGAR